MRTIQLPSRDIDSRPSGLAAVGAVTWGTHVCHFFRDSSDLLEVLVPFFQAGLEANEQCLWITADPLPVADATDALAAAVPDLPQRLAHGQIEILSHADWYLRSAKLSAEQVLHGWLEREATARANGYDGLRITGNTAWLEHADWDKFVDYESDVHRSFHTQRIIALCSYSLAKCTVDNIIDVIRNHRFALARRDGQWHSIQSATELVTVVRPAGGESGQRREALRSSCCAPAIDSVYAADSTPGELADTAMPEPPLSTDRAFRRAPHSAAEHLARLQGLTWALSEAAGLTEIGAAVMQALSQKFGADAALLALASVHAEDGLTLLAQTNLAPAQIERLDASPLAEVQRSRRPLWLESRAAIVEHYPAALAVFPHAHALCCLPLVVRDRSLGVLGLTHASGYYGDVVQRALLEDYVKQVALALDRAVAYEAAERTRARLQLLADAGRRIGRAGLGLTQVMQSIVGEVTQAGFADCSAISLCSDDGETLSLVALHHLNAERRADAERMLRGQPIRIGEGIVGTVASTGKPARITSREEAAHRFRAAYRAYLERYPISTMLVVALRASDRIIGTLAASRDYPSRPFSADDEALLQEIADRAALSVENALLYERARSERGRAESANAAKDEFLAMLGHELRNPLSPILTAAQLMRLRGGDLLVKERMTIERQVHHMVRLVDDLLDVSRIARGKIELKRTPIELAQVIANAIEIVSPLLEERCHRMQTSVPSAGLLVDADVSRLTQVVANLLSNAAKYMHPNGTVEVTAQHEGDRAILRVRDHGVGIEPDLMPRIFDLFAQGKQASDRAQGGLGLGLTIARNLTEMHGGVLRARSEGAGKGAEFILELPLLRDRRMAHASISHAAAVTFTPGRKILVVDDNADAADSLCEALCALGHHAAVAYDGPSALRVAAEFRPHLALLDIGLPAMDGYELGQELRTTLGDAAPRLVALTGYGQQADRRRSADAGFYDHLVKPADFERLQHIIETLAFDA